jgi:transposase
MNEDLRLLVPREAEEPMVELELVDRIHLLHQQHPKWGARRISYELGLARNTVRRYLRGAEAKHQERLRARSLDEATRAKALELLHGTAEGNAVVVRRLLRDEGVEVGLRTLQRVVQPSRAEVKAAEVATVRFETLPGEQMQVDFGQRQVRIGEQSITVYFFVAVLGYSRRLFVRPSLSSRQDEWRAGLAGAFEHFGGLPRVVLIDNDGALVTGRDRESGTAKIHPAFADFCKEWEVSVRACQPYRARTKGKTESGVKYVKKNGIAGRKFASFAALQAWLPVWMAEADQRIHGTTHEKPALRFEQAEHAALRKLPARPVPLRPRVLQRKVASDCLVDVDTVRYSVPHRLVRRAVEVHVTPDSVRILHQSQVVAEHRRSYEPHTQVVDPEHWRGLWRQEPLQVPTGPGPLEQFGRSLGAYAEAIGGAS